MTIEELGDIMNEGLVIRQRANNEDLEKYYCSFEGAEVKEAIGLIGAFGDGDTPNEAIADYVARIQGKVLVLGAHRDERRE